MPGVTQLSLPRLGFAIQAAGPRACVLSHLCLKSRCGTISPGMENFVTQYQPGGSCLFSVYVEHCVFRVLTTCQAFLNVPRSCLRALNAEPQAGRRLWKMLGSRAIRGNAGGTGSDAHPSMCRQVQDGKQEPHPSGGRPGRSRRDQGSAWHRRSRRCPQAKPGPERGRR